MFNYIKQLPAVVLSSLVSCVCIIFEKKKKQFLCEAAFWEDTSWNHWC